MGQKLRIGPRPHTQSIGFPSLPRTPPRHNGAHLFPPSSPRILRSQLIDRTHERASALVHRLISQPPFSQHRGAIRETPVIVHRHISEPQISNVTGHMVNFHGLRRNDTSNSTDVVTRITTSSVGLDPNTIANIKTTSSATRGFALETGSFYTKHSRSVVVQAVHRSRFDPDIIVRGNVIPVQSFCDGAIHPSSNTFNRTMRSFRNAIPRGNIGTAKAKASTPSLHQLRELGTAKSGIIIRKHFGGCSPLKKDRLQSSTNAPAILSFQSPPTSEPRRTAINEREEMLSVDVCNVHD